MEKAIFGYFLEKGVAIARDLDTNELVSVDEKPGSLVVGDQNADGSLG